MNWPLNGASRSTVDDHSFGHSVQQTPPHSLLPNPSTTLIGQQTPGMMNAFLPGCVQSRKQERLRALGRFHYQAGKLEAQMKKLMTAIIVLTVLGLSGTEALSQKGIMWRGGGGWGPGASYGRMYNPQTIETLSGEVVSIDKITPMRGMSYGVHATLKTDKETIPVHLGPGWYIENQDVKVAPRDKIVVKGSRITLEGKPAIIAAEVTRGDDVLVLRDMSGFPVWSGWRRR